MTLAVQIIGISTAIYLVALPWIALRQHPDVPSRELAIAGQFRLITPIIILLAALTIASELG